MTLATRDLAKALGVSVTRVNELGRKGKISREPDGQWDLAKVRAQLGRNLDIRQTSPARGDAAPEVSRRPSMGRPEEAPQKGTLAHAQLMHEQAKAAVAAMTAQKLEGKLLPAREVEQVWAGVISGIRARMLLVADKVAARVAAESSALECRAIVDHAIRDALSAASDYQPTANAA